MHRPQYDRQRPDLFAAALRAAKRVRTETGLSRGHASVSSVAVDFVREVFDRFLRLVG